MSNLNVVVRLQLASPTNRCFNVPNRQLYLNILEELVDAAGLLRSNCKDILPDERKELADLQGKEALSHVKVTRDGTGQFFFVEILPRGLEIALVFQAAIYGQKDQTVQEKYWALLVAAEKITACWQNRQPIDVPEPLPLKPVINPVMPPTDMNFRKISDRSGRIDPVKSIAVQDTAATSEVVELMKKIRAFLGGLPYSQAGFASLESIVEGIHSDQADLVRSIMEQLVERGACRKVSIAMKIYYQCKSAPVRLRQIDAEAARMIGHQYGLTPFSKSESCWLGSELRKRIPGKQIEILAIWRSLIAEGVIDVLPDKRFQLKRTCCVVFPRYCRPETGKGRVFSLLEDK